MLVGSAHVSTLDQKPGVQTDALSSLGVIAFSPKRRAARSATGQSYRPRLTISAQVTPW